MDRRNLSFFVHGATGFLPRQGVCFLLDFMCLKYNQDFLFSLSFPSSFSLPPSLSSPSLTILGIEPRTSGMLELELEPSPSISYLSSPCGSINVLSFDFFLHSSSLSAQDPACHHLSHRGGHCVFSLKLSASMLALESMNPLLSSPS